MVFFPGLFWWDYPYPYYAYAVDYGHYGESYEKLGKESGKELKHGKVTMEQFTAFLRLDILKASDEARSSFQVGFVKGYGKNALSVYTQALGQAREGAVSKAGAANTPPEPVAGSPTPAPVPAPKYW